MIIELNISLEATEKTTDEIRQRKEAINRQSAEFNQWMTRIKARLDAIAGKIERDKRSHLA
jgi:chaperonin cofactor prefoldin